MSEKVKSKKVKKQKENHIPMSKKEQKIYSFIIILTILFVLSTFIVVLIIRNDKDLISRRFKDLEKNHIYEYITFDEYKKKINNGDEFLVLFVDENDPDSRYIVYFVNDIIKELESDHETDYGVVYLFLTTSIDSKTQNYLRKNIDNNILDKPNVVYYKKTISTTSVDYDSTSRYDITKYHNSFELLKDFFSKIFIKVEQED